MHKITKTLAKYAATNLSAKVELQNAQTEAFAAVVAGKGREVVSTSGNGISVTFAAGKSNEEWCNIVSEALSIVENGLPPKRKQAIFVNE